MFVCVYARVWVEPDQTGRQGLLFFQMHDAQQDQDEQFFAIITLSKTHGDWMCSYDRQVEKQAMVHCRAKNAHTGSYFV